jgi:nucleotide-binding universal stress UspA family protein
VIRSILVPLDGSTFGEHALPVALGIARRVGAVLQLAHVHQVVPPASVAGVALMDNLELTMRKEEQTYLDGVARRIVQAAPLRVVTALLNGEVAEALHTHAAAGADLVVMATHGRGALGRFWLGSVADELIRHLSVPLLLVRPSAGPANLAATAEPRRILLPLDGTALAEQIIPAAMELAEKTDAEVTLLRVVQPVVRFDYLPEGTSVAGISAQLDHEIGEHQRRHEHEAQVYLEHVADRLRARLPSVRVRVVVDDAPATAILREAEALGVDLIALETHGRRGLSRLIVGSVADKVIRGAHVPVLVHRPMPLARPASAEAPATKADEPAGVAG